MIDLNDLFSGSNELLDASNIAIIVAHPDDEIIGCGILLTKLRNAKIIFITDGIPYIWNIDSVNKKIKGLTIRQLEALSVLSMINISKKDIIFFDIPDMLVCYLLEKTIRMISQFICDHKINYVFTHAYEGGHPDHDATSYCVSQVQKMVYHIQPFTIYEMPLYHCHNGLIVRQKFCDESQGTIMHHRKFERKLKIDLLSKYRSQHNILHEFHNYNERFRIMKDYNYLELPNKGECFYEKWNCPVTPQDWSNSVFAYLSRKYP